MLAVAVTLIAGSAFADTITGTVRNTSGQPIASVTVNAVSVATGAVAATIATTATGTFTLTVVAGVYTIDFAPTGTTVAPAEFANMNVAGTLNLGFVTLQPGLVLTGTVTTTTGALIVNGDTDVINAATGVKLYTPNDNTNASGVFSVVVPAGVYNVTADAPTGGLFVSQQVSNVVVNAATNVGFILLPPGFLLSATVRNATTQAALANVDIDVDLMSNGQRLITPNDKTDALGAFSLVVPPGSLRVTFDPPPGAAILPKRVENVNVTGALNMGIVGLTPGFLITGTVTATTGPVANVDLDVNAILGTTRLYTPNDVTDATGAFALAVPAGNYQLIANAPAGAALASVGLQPIAVTNANVNLGNLFLPPGVTLQGTVIGALGGPEAGVNIDVIDPVTNAEVPTPRDVTDAAGHYSVVVPPGTWNLLYRPINASLSATSAATGVPITAATTRNVTLATTSMTFLMIPYGGPPTLGTSAISAGGVLTFDAAIYNATGTTQTVVASLYIVDPTGVNTFILAPFPLSMPSGALVIVPGVTLGTPVFPPSLNGFNFRMRGQFNDPVSGLEVDHDEFRFIVQ